MHYTVTRRCYGAGMAEYRYADLWETRMLANFLCNLSYVLSVTLNGSLNSFATEKVLCKRYLFLNISISDF